MLHNAGKGVGLYCSSLSEGLSSLMGFCGNPEGSSSEMKNIIARGRAEKSPRWLCVNKRSGHLNKHKLLINTMQTQSFARRRLFDWTACALRALGSHGDILISIVLRWIQTISVLNIDVCRSMLLLNWWNKGLWRRKRRRRPGPHSPMKALLIGTNMLQAQVYLRPDTPNWRKVKQDVASCEFLLDTCLINRQGSWIAANSSQNSYRGIL